MSLVDLFKQALNVVPAWWTVCFAVALEGDIELFMQAETRRRCRFRGWAAVDSALPGYRRHLQQLQRVLAELAPFYIVTAGEPATYASSCALWTASAVRDAVWPPRKKRTRDQS